MPVSVLTSNSITGIEGYACFAEVKVGGNGDQNGIPEYDCGSSSEDTISGRRTWDSDLSDGMDSGTVSVELEANPNGGTDGVSWTVSDGSTIPLLFSDASYGAITSVQVRAATQFSNMKFTWLSLVVHFYKNGSINQTISLSASQLPKVDTTDAEDPIESEMITTITPTDSDNTKVIIAGTLEMEFSATEVPDPEALFGQIFLFSE